MEGRVECVEGGWGGWGWRGEWDGGEDRERGRVGVKVCWEYVDLLFLFRQLCCVRLVGILLLVYIKHDLSQFVSDVETDTVMTGMLGLMVRVCSVGWGWGRGCMHDLVFSLPRATRGLSLYTSISTTPHCVLSMDTFLLMQKSWRREIRSVCPHGHPRVWRRLSTCFSSHSGLPHHHEQNELL